MFPANGKNFSLDLTFSKDFIAPALVVQHYSGNSTWRSETHRSVGLSQCFYSGRINQDLNSRGVFSLCEGLVSTNQTTSNLLQLPDPPPSQLITRKNRTHYGGDACSFARVCTPLCIVVPHPRGFHLIDEDHLLLLNQKIPTKVLLLARFRLP